MVRSSDGQILLQHLQRRSSRFHLCHLARLRRLVRSPAEKLRAVAEAAAGEVIVLHFDHEFWIERFPFAEALGAPSARPTRRASREPAAFLRWLAKLLQLRRERFPLRCSKR